MRKWFLTSSTDGVIGDYLQGISYELQGKLTGKLTGNLQEKLTGT